MSEPMNRWEADRAEPMPKPSRWEERERLEREWSDAKRVRHGVNWLGAARGFVYVAMALVVVSAVLSVITLFEQDPIVRIIRDAQASIAWFSAGAIAAVSAACGVVEIASRNT